MRSALIGSVVWWIALAAVAAGHADLGTIERLFLFGPLVAVPLALELARRFDQPMTARPWLSAAAAVQTPAAVLVLLSFLMRKGAASAALTVPWLAFSGLVALAGLLRVLHGPWNLPAIILDAAFGFIPVGASQLFLSRLGATPMGFVEPIVLLTAVHFHFTAFCAVVVAAATAKWLARYAADRLRWFRWTAAAMVAGIPLLAVGWMTSPHLKVSAVVLLTAGAATLSAWLLWVAPQAGARDRSTGLLLAAAGLSSLVGIALAGVYGVGEYTQRYWITIPTMAKFHGTLNAFGFTLCGLAGFLKARD